MEPLSLYEGITVCLNKKVVSQRKKAYQPRRANKKPHIHPHSPLSLITHQFKNLLLHSSITHIQPTPVLPTYKKTPSSSSPINGIHLQIQRHRNPISISPHQQ
uniref:Uncharacterized protein n=1 Tax=Opuntia streptacantha TaxID=393608 RepID=A0A7C9D4X0_OPUST